MPAMVCPPGPVPSGMEMVAAAPLLTMMPVYRPIEGMVNEMPYQNPAPQFPLGTFITPLRPAALLTFSENHRFHDQLRQSGSLRKDGRQFTKTQFDGRLSIVTEDCVHTGGVQRYLMQFTSGEMSSADGVGFVFSGVLPCPKNIQRIVSIFVNAAGRICMRAKTVVKRSDISVKRLELGDWIELVVDLDQQVAHCTVWPENGSLNSSATFHFGNVLSTLLEDNATARDTCSMGYFGCLVKKEGVTVTFGS